jgi:BirA family biotin operon repressor/biotin-[acetyl-CoA-carboxylase] ligase
MIGDTIIELASVDSTNAYAASAEFKDGTVIWAHNQFAGRGQHDRQWHSEAGKNLTFTVVLKPGFLAPDRQFQLNKSISLGLLDFVHSFSPHALKVKWPNDIYAGSRKLGGILIENRIMGSRLGTSFVGIGLNVNQTCFSPEIPNPVSLVQLGRHELVLKDALLSLCHCLNKRYTALCQEDTGGLDLEFDQNLLGYRQWRSYMIEGRQLEGQIMGVDESGRLMIEQRNGKVAAFFHGGIEYVL